MYIEQLKSSGIKFWTYIPFTILFFAIIGSNFILSDGIDTNVMMQNYINEFGETITFLMLIIPLVVLFFVLLFWVKIGAGQSIRSLTTARAKVDWSRMFFSFMVWSIFTIGSTLIYFYFSPTDFEINFNASAFFPFVIIALLTIPFQTSFEEYFFRGHLMQGLGLGSNNKLFPLIITSVLFGLMHWGNPEVAAFGPIVMIYYIGTGFFLGIITLMDDGLELALGFHAANNLIGALLLTSSNSAFQTPSILKDISEVGSSSFSEIIIPVLIIYPLLILLFAKKYNWSSFKTKLFGKLQS